MPKFIMHKDGWFFEWQTITDCASTKPMRRAEFEAWYRRQYFGERVADFSERMERAERAGTSSLMGETFESTLSLNTYGPDETSLPVAEVLKILGISQ